jgi:hypothetical protein
MSTNGGNTSIAATLGKVLFAGLLMLLAIVIADYTTRPLDSQSTTPSSTEAESVIHRSGGD